MASNRWLNLFLWGLGDRADGTNDYRSDILLLVDVLVWVGLLTFLVQVKSGFLTLWLGAPLVGQPIYWIGTQFIIGYLTIRGGRGKNKKAPAVQQPKPTAVPQTSEPAPSEEP